MITGSRDWTSRPAIVSALTQLGATSIVEGGQRGADTIARDVALEDLGIDCATYWANWKLYKRAAGPIRNERMFASEHPAHVAAFPLKGSIGTWDAIERACLRGIPVTIFDGFGRARHRAVWHVRVEAQEHDPA